MAQTGRELQALAQGQAGGSDEAAGRQRGAQGQPMTRRLRIPTTDERANNLTCLALAYRVAIQNDVPQKWRDGAVKALRVIDAPVNESPEG